MSGLYVCGFNRNVNVLGLFENLMILNFSFYIMILKWWFLLVNVLWYIIEVSLDIVVSFFCINVVLCIVLILEVKGLIF